MDTGRSVDIDDLTEIASPKAQVLEQEQEMEQNSSRMTGYYEECDDSTSSESEDDSVNVTDEEPTGNIPGRKRKLKSKSLSKEQDLENTVEQASGSETPNVNSSTNNWTLEERHRLYGVKMRAYEKELYQSLWSLVKPTSNNFTGSPTTLQILEYACEKIENLRKDE